MMYPLDYPHTFYPVYKGNPECKIAIGNHHKASYACNDY